MMKRLFGRGATAKDLVCGMGVDPGDPPGGVYDHAGTTYYFCGDSCRRAFEKDPSTFLQAAGAGEPVPQAANSDPTAPITFSAVDDPSGEGKFVDVEYKCVCGCRPGARVEAGSTEAASEHCCCGRVHFAGDDAEQQLRSYMADRAETDMDEDVGPYVYSQAEAVSASGKRVAVSYAQPEHPRK